MSRKMLSGIMLIVLLMVAPTVWAQPPAGNAPEFVSVFIGFRNTPGTSEQALVHAHGGVVKYSYTLVPVIAASVPEQAVRALSANPAVVLIEPVIKAYAVDVELDNTWGVKRIGGGTAPEADIHALKVLGADGSGSYDDIIAAVDWCVAKSFDIANLSLGSSQNPGVAVQAAFDRAYAAGLLIVAAAGNSGNPSGRGDNVIYPARYDSVIAVAASNSSDVRASFSRVKGGVKLRHFQEVSARMRGRSRQ